MRHGTHATYTNLHCRCDLCRAANTEYYRRRRLERQAITAAGQCPAVHGRYATYDNWGCRCAECSEAKRQINRHYRQTRERSDG